MTVWKTTKRNAYVVTVTTAEPVSPRVAAAHIREHLKGSVAGIKGDEVITKVTVTSVSEK